MQDLLVYPVVLAALAYLARTLWSAASGGKSGCNSCGSSCAAKQSSTPAAPQLIQIDLNRK